tara:strand:+ start:161 stop:661 length:501 start_codon:yes stop_codon:yes gene_type:complete
MKKFFQFLFFLFILINTTNLNAKENIVFIDLNYVLNESNNGKKILDELKNINEKNKKKFSNEEAQLDKERNDIKKLKNIISKEEYNKKVALFQEKVELYNKEKTKIIKSFENKKKKELDNFFNNLNNIMNIYMKENKISLIIEKKNIVMAATKNDISNQILELVNK